MRNMKPHKGDSTNGKRYTAAPELPAFSRVIEGNDIGCGDIGSIGRIIEHPLHQTRILCDVLDHCGLIREYID